MSENPYTQFDAGVDRLAELRNQANTVVSDDNHPVPAEQRQLAFSIDVNASITEHMRRYDLIKSSIDEISSNIHRITQLSLRNKTLANERQRKDVMKQLDLIMNNTGQHATAIKNTFNEIQAENKLFHQQRPNSTEYNMRINLYNTHIRKYYELMNAYNGIVQQFKLDMQRRTIRELKIIDSSLTDEQITQIVESGKANDYIAQALVDGDLKNTVREIEQRHGEIVKLEAQVREIFELFRDLQAIVDTQQEHLDIIDNNILQSYEQTKKAEADLEVGAVYVSKVRRRKCCIIFILLVVLTVVLAPIIVTQYKKHSS
jgi:t-SNARE complex subunit (syntaxin)